MKVEEEVVDVKEVEEVKGWEEGEKVVRLVWFRKVNKIAVCLALGASLSLSLSLSPVQQAHSELLHAIQHDLTNRM